MVIKCQVLQEIGYGLTREMVEHVIINYVQENGRSDTFLRSRPGKDWWQGFWPSLVERKPQHLPGSRAKAVTEAAVDAWLAKFSEHQKSEAKGYGIVMKQHLLLMWHLRKSLQNEAQIDRDRLRKRVHHSPRLWFSKWCTPPARPPYIVY